MYPEPVDDADPGLSKAILAHAALGAALNLAFSFRDRGLRGALVLFALGAGLPALGELLVTGPLGLLRHRTRPRLAGVPPGVLLGWYCAIHGSFTVTARILARLPMDEDRRHVALPFGAALVGTSLDLILDPFGLDAGLWEWTTDGVYAPEVVGANGRSGVPLINYLGWISLVASVVYVHERLFDDGTSPDLDASRVPGLLLLPYYLAAAVWAVRRRRLRYLVYSVIVPVALGVSLRGW